jgi:hypothetical protein
MILVVPVAFIAFALLGGCGSTTYTPTANEEIYGTWVNEQAPPGSFSVPLAVYAPGLVKTYKIAGSAAAMECKLQITNKWKDSGNVWYKCIETITGGTEGDIGTVVVLLYKLSKSATIMEAAVTIRRAIRNSRTRSIQRR